MENGTFISFEGGEGAGKSTLIEGIAAWLADHGCEVIVTREPGGIRISEAIRTVILDKSHTEMEARTEALLYAAARRQHLIEKVIPSMKEGKVVLCDRFVDSSLVYQGYARGIGIEEVWTINRFAIGPHLPELTLYMDISPEAGLKRIHQAAAREINRLDLETLEFHHRVRDGYRMLQKQHADRIVAINADQSKEAVLKAAKEVFINRIKGFSHFNVK